MRNDDIWSKIVKYSVAPYRKLLEGDAKDFREARATRALSIHPFAKRSRIHCRMAGSFAAIVSPRLQATNPAREHVTWRTRCPRDCSKAARPFLTLFMTCRWFMTAEKDKKATLRQFLEMYCVEEQIRSMKQPSNLDNETWRTSRQLR